MWWLVLSRSGSSVWYYKSSQCVCVCSIWNAQPMLSDNAQTKQKTYSSVSVFLTLIPLELFSPSLIFLLSFHLASSSVLLALSTFSLSKVSNFIKYARVIHVIWKLCFLCLFSWSPCPCLSFILSLFLDVSCLSCFFHSSLCSPICKHRKVNMFLRLL